MINSKNHRPLSLRGIYRLAQEKNEADELINDLLQEKNQEEQKIEKKEYYQLPVKGGKKSENGLEESWIVGHFAPGQYLNTTHPAGHNGVDLKHSEGTPIYPIASGKVIYTGQNPKGGNSIKVSHENGAVISYYAHLQSINVSSGQEVNQKTIIGIMGQTGNAKGRGAHLHYEGKVHGSHIDPLSLTGKEVGSLSKENKKTASKNWEEFLEKNAFDYLKRLY